MGVDVDFDVAVLVPVVLGSLKAAKSLYLGGSQDGSEGENGTCLCVCHFVIVEGVFSFFEREIGYKNQALLVDGDIQAGWICREVVSWPSLYITTFTFTFTYLDASFRSTASMMKGYG